MMELVVQAEAEVQKKDHWQGDSEIKGQATGMEEASKADVRM